MKSGTENWNTSSLTGIKFAYKCSLICPDFIVHKPLEVDFLLKQYLKLRLIKLPQNMLKLWWLGLFVLFLVMQLIISLLAAFCSDLPNIEFLLKWTVITEYWIKIAPCLGVEFVNVIYCLCLSVNLQIERSKQSSFLKLIIWS